MKELGMEQHSSVVSQEGDSGLVVEVDRLLGLCGEVSRASVIQGRVPRAESVDDTNRVSFESTVMVRSFRA